MGSTLLIPQPHDDARLLREVVGDVLDGGVLFLVLELLPDEDLVEKYFMRHST